MSEIKVDTLTGKTTANDITVTVGASATQSLEQGLAKVWGNLNGSGTIALRDSFNVASVTDNGTGQYDFNYTNNMNDANYAGIEGTNASLTFYYDTQTGETQIRTYNTSSNLADYSRVHISCLGDLA